MNFHSQAGQDRWVWEMTRHTETGFFIDIGAADPVINNNSYALELAGWQGVCVEQTKPQEGMTRKATWITADATTMNWEKTIKDLSIPSCVDYLSLDIDDWSLLALNNILPHLQFRLITIEHDRYRLGDKMRGEMRNILRSLNYLLVCGDVNNDNLPFEDWWIYGFDSVLVANSLMFKSDNKGWTEILKLNK